MYNARNKCFIVFMGVVCMWRPEMVLEAYLNDPNVKLSRGQVYILDNILERVAEPNGPELEVVTNPDFLPGVFVAYYNEDAEQSVMAFVELPFSSEEELIDYILSDDHDGVIQIEASTYHHPREILDAINRHSATGVISVYLGDYFLSDFVASESGNRVIERMPREKKRRLHERLHWFDEQIEIVSLRQRLDMAMEQRDFELCKAIKRRLDDLTDTATQPT